MTTLYTNLYDITELQQKIVKFIMLWAHQNKTPISRKEIITQMVKESEDESTVIHALDGMLRLGYIRRANIISNKTYYVLLRTT